MRALSRSLATLVAVALLTACGGHGSPSAVPLAPQPPLQPSSTASGPIAYGQSVLASSVPVGPAKLANIDIGVMVRMQDAVGLAQYARDVNDPHSGRFHQFLTPDQVADRFGATKADYAAVQSYFASKGLATMGWRQRELLRVSGSQAALEAALGAKFGTFAKNGRTFYGLTSAPAAIARLPISALVGAVNYAQITNRPIKLASGAPTAISGYAPQQIATAFDYNGAYAAGYTGTGVKIGIIGTGPILAADFTTYRGLYHLTGSSTITQVDVTGTGFATPPPTTDTCTIPSTGPSATCNPEDIEAQLDTQQTAGLARDASVLFYLAYAPNINNSGSNAEGIQLTNYEIQQAINDNRADVLSLSFGVGELDDVGGDFNLGPNGLYDPNNSPGPMAFATLAAMGVAVFVSSGDDGALGCQRDGTTNVNNLCVSYPATDPNVVAIGGVNTPLDAEGKLVGPLTGWGLQTGLGSLQSASGGGVSKYFPLPAYQTGVAGITGSTRNTPDISLEGDGATGVAVLSNSTFPDAALFPVGGTSIAAPEAAAMWSLVLQACSANLTTCKATPGTGGVAYRLGNPDPAFYAIYGNPTQYPATFTDVLFGDNSQLPICASPQTGATPCPSPNPTPIAGYQAGKGYDLVTGIGVPAGRALIKAVVGV
jgi:pseudomonalisin